AHIRLAMARAKNGLSAAVIHAARVGRVPVGPCHFGSLPSRKRALTTLFCSGIRISPRGPGLRGGPGGVTSVKNAAYCQNWLRVQRAKGWLWHCAHSRLTPRNSRDVLPARFSGLDSLAW